MKKHDNDTEKTKIYNCPKCNHKSILRLFSYKEAIRLKRLCKSCAMKKWQIEKYGEKKDRTFILKCSKCGKAKKHTWKNQSETQLKRLKKDLSKKLCKSCSNSINYVLPKIKFNTKPELKFKKILEKFKIKYIQSFKLENKIYDFYITKLNILVEIDGNYWHGKGLKNEELNPTQKRNRTNDTIKNNLAKKHNIKLIRIWEDEIDEISFINEING